MLQLTRKSRKEPIKPRRHRNKTKFAISPMPHPNDGCSFHLLQNTTTYTSHKFTKYSVDITDYSIKIIYINTNTLWFSQTDDENRQQEVPHQLLP